MRKVLLFSLIAAALFFADFFLKTYVHHFLPLMGWDSPFYPYGGIAVFENWCGIDFSINHVMNKGAAWGMLASFHIYLFYARILIIAALLVHLVFFAASQQKLPLLLIITGAFANVYDHIIYGHVIDMFYFRFWGYSFPVFNIADSAIFCGIVWLLILSFIKQRSRSASAHE
jgi:signal peptidase II